MSFRFHTTPIRRAISLTLVLGLFAVLVAWLGTNQDGAEAATLPTKPNIVFIQTDDQTVCSVLDLEMCPKQSKQVMPRTLELLANQGTTFETYFATHPRCCPSRASQLTGMYSHNHGILSNSHGYGKFQFHDRALPVWLKDAGYNTAHVGKYMNGYFGRFADALPVPPGWDEWYATVDDGTYHMYNYNLMVKSDHPVRTLAGDGLTPPSPEPQRFRIGNRPEDYQTDVEASIAVDFITRQAAEPSPFYLAVNPLAPHHEHIGFGKRRNPRPAPRDEGRFKKVKIPRGKAFDEADVSDKPADIQKKPRLDKDAIDFITLRYQSRLESLLAVDDMIQRIYTALETSGQLENTVIIFTSDNGFMLGEHRLKSGKIALYDESVRQPLIIRGPGFPINGQREQLTGNIDLAPTIADIADANPLLTVDGISLLDYAANPALDNGRAILLENGVDGGRAVRDGRYTYVKNKSGKELYDNVKDPFEVESLHDAKPFRGVVRDLNKRLKALDKCAGATCLQ